MGAAALPGVKFCAGAKEVQTGVMSPISYRRHLSSLGPLLFRAEAGRLTGLFFADRAHAPIVGPDRIEDEESAILDRAIGEVEEFIAGERSEFGLEFFACGTPFQQKVWREIAAIPYGKTVRYGEIARRLGAPDAVRAVGAAAGRNPLCLIIPCHRVVGSAGALTGYAGGLDRKRRLLELERAPAFASCTASVG